MSHGRAKYFFRWIGTVGYYFAGLILVLAAAGKLLDVAFDLNRLSQQPTLVLILAIAELWIGLNLILGKAEFRCLAWVFAVLLGVGFSGNAVYRLAGNTFDDCNCLGVFQTEWIPPSFLLGGYLSALVLSFNACFSSLLLSESIAQLSKTIVVEVAVLALAFIVLNSSLTTMAGRELIGLPTYSAVGFLDCIGNENCAVDLGKVQPGREYRHTFRLKNFGTNDVEILGSWVSCGCTTVVLEAQTMAPGSSLDIPVVFLAPKDAGPVDAFLKVHLDNAAVSDVTARMTCKVGS